jgi:hypothetical protein
MANADSSAAVTGAAFMPLLRCGISVALLRRSVLPRFVACRAGGHASWVKLRAFGLTQYDAVLLVDSNAHFAADVSPLFSLPTDFASAWDQARWLGSNHSALHAVSGGALFLRPCAATEAHMLDILSRGGGEAQPQLRRGALPAQVAQGDAAAEQDFLSW